MRGGRPFPQQGNQTLAGNFLPLRKDQCVYCKQKGHWEQDCPQSPGRMGNPQSGETSQIERLLTLDHDIYWWGPGNSLKDSPTEPLVTV